MAKNINKNRVNNACLAALDINSRLLNHRHFLAGELAFFAKVVDKTNEHIDRTLIQDDQSLKEERDRKMESVRKFLVSDHIKSLTKQVDKLNYITEQILDLERKADQQQNQLADEHKLERDQYEQKINRSMEDKLRGLEKFYSQRRTELAKHYQELQQKWKEEEEEEENNDDDEDDDEDGRRTT